MYYQTKIVSGPKITSNQVYLVSFSQFIRVNSGATKQVFFFYFLGGCFPGYFPKEMLKNRPLCNQQKLFQVQKLATIKSPLRVNSGALHQASLLFFYFLGGCFPGRKVSLAASEVGLDREAVRARLCQSVCGVSRYMSIVHMGQSLFV